MFFTADVSLGNFHKAIIQKSVSKIIQKRHINVSPRPVTFRFKRCIKQFSEPNVFEAECNADSLRQYKYQ